MNQLFLIAHVAGRTVAIGAEQVESVVDIGPIVAVPRTSGHVRGLAALRSRVVTVIDTVAALGIDARDSEPGRAVITQVDGHHYALLVDTLDDVAPFQLEPIAQGIALTGAWREAARGLVQRDGEPILAIDLRAIVPGGSPAAHAA